MKTSLGATTIGQPYVRAIVKRGRRIGGGPGAHISTAIYSYTRGSEDRDKQWLQGAFGLSVTSNPPQGASSRCARLLTWLPRAPMGCEGE
jgi:hypothetical protein